MRAGDEVEVRSAGEILATLDETGCLDGMPFMPEMFSLCGQRLRIAKVAHKTCDTISHTGGRSVTACVHLENSICDGSAHGGCQARCSLFWKEAWLRRPGAPHAAVARTGPARCSEAAVAEATFRDEAGKRRYRCQATQLLEASKPLAWWDPRQYLLDVLTGNASAATVAKVLVMSWLTKWRAFGYPYRLSHWAYEQTHWLLFRRPAPYQRTESSYPKGPAHCARGIMPGERVRIKTHDEIRPTLKNGRNRGLWFDAEMVPFCGGEFTVAQRVERIVDERTGEMIEMKGSCIILDGVVCRSQYSDRRLLCPRALPPFWRETWLDRSTDDRPSGREMAPSGASDRK